MLANYIEQIEIESLWSGRRHIRWQLRPDVNILSGVNGMGKTTILNRLVSELKALNEAVPSTSLREPRSTSVHITLAPHEATEVRFDVVRSFDNTMIPTSLAADNRRHYPLGARLAPLRVAAPLP